MLAGLSRRKRLLVGAAVVAPLVVAASVLLLADDGANDRELAGRASGGSTTTVAGDSSTSDPRDRPASSTTSSARPGDRPGRESGRPGREAGGSTGTGGGTTPTGVDPPPSGSTPPPPPVGGGGALPLGSFALTGESDPQCAAGWECIGFSVSCPNVEREQLGWFWIGAASAPPRGLVAFFSGAGGNDAWTQGSAIAEAKLDDLRSTGFEVVQVRWRQKGWLAASAGERVGPAGLACKPATAVAWLHDNRYARMGVDAGPGRCGFCLTGNSGGASQIAYVLSHYGLAGRIDAVIPSSGPPHAALTKGCLRDPAHQAYWFPGAASVIDSSYGFTSGTGPCVNHDASWVATWDRDSVDLGGSSYRYPTTRVHFLIPETQDDVVAAAHGADYAAQVKAAGSPWVREQVVAGMGHDIYLSSAGLAALEAAILGAP